MGWAGITVLVYAAVMALLTVLPEGLLRDPQTHSLLNSPFMDGIIFFMMLLFLLPGLAYGIGAGTLKNSRDAVALVNKSISGLAGFMVLIFFAAQFTACFNYSNLGTIISVKGADFLQSVGLTGLPLIVCFILLTAGINIFIAVDSAKWAIMAPIFCPHVHASGSFTGADPGSVQDWGFQYQYHCSPDALFRIDGGVFPEIR